MFSTYIISLIFTFILFLILLFGKRYYDGIGLTKIEEEEEEEDELSVKYYNNTNKDVRGSYFSDEVIDCEETIESSDTCVEIGQDLVTILQYPMNGGKKCTDKICKNSDIYNCETTRGRKPGVFIQKRSDNKFLNIDLIPCADESSFVLEDGYVYDPPISQEEIDKMTCKDTDIERITVKNSEGEDMSWDVILKWEDFDVSGFATLWKLEVTQVSSGRDRFNLHTILKDSTLGIYKKIYLVPKDNNYARQLNRWQIALSYDESAFHEHSQWSDGVNLICEKDNTQLIVYKPVLTACVSITGFNSKSKIKRNSDGKYLVISGPKLLKYYEDRANAENYEFQKVYDENGYYYTESWTIDIDNRTSKHQLCFGGDNDHVSYTTNADDATIFIINKDGGNLKIKLEFEVTNFNITQGTTEIGSYESPHTVTKYIELLENGDLSLCDNYKNFNTVRYAENSDLGPPGEITEKMTYYGSYGIGRRDYNTYSPYQSDKITIVTDSNDLGWGSQARESCSVYKTDTKCFYGSSEPIDNSYSAFIQKYELVNIEKDDYTRQEPTGNNIGCSNDINIPEEKKACQIDYKKCISLDDFYSYHGNMSEFILGGDFEITTDYSFGKCVPKTQFLNKLLETNTDGNLKWSSELTDIVTRKCDQIIECDQGMESSIVFNAADEQKQQGHMIKQFMDKNYPDDDFDFGDLPVNTKGPVYEIVRKFQDDEMKPITYSQACTIKTE